MHNIFAEHNNHKNKLHEEKVESKELYPWLEPDDPRRKMTDRQIIESTIDLSQSCLSKEEQEEVYKLLVKYREVFSLRDEIGVCSYIEVDMQVIDKSPFFHQMISCQRRDKPMVDKEMQRLVHLGILKKEMLTLTSSIFKCYNYCLNVIFY